MAHLRRDRFVAEVTFNFFMNKASNVVEVLLNTYNHHTETNFTFIISVPMSWSKSIYVVPL